MESRINTILKLWTKTENYLIIVEEGTNAGFKVSVFSNFTSYIFFVKFILSFFFSWKLVNEARDFILKYTNSKRRRETQFVHVFSPVSID